MSKFSLFLKQCLLFLLALIICTISMFTCCSLFAIPVISVFLVLFNELYLVRQPLRLAKFKLRQAIILPLLLIFLTFALSFTLRVYMSYSAFNMPDLKNYLGLIVTYNSLSIFLSVVYLFIVTILSLCGTVFLTIIYDSRDK